MKKYIYKPRTEIRPSIYIIEDTNDGFGFKITNTKINCSINVLLENNRFSVIDNSILDSDKEFLNKQTFELLNFHDIIKCCASRFASKKAPKFSSSLTIKEQAKYFGIQKWSIKKTGMALAKRITNKLKELYNKINPDVLFVHKKLFSILGPKQYLKKSYLITDEFIKLNPLWVKDLKNYNAAILPLVHDYYAIVNVEFDKWMNYFPLTKISEARKGLIKTLMTATGRETLFMLTDKNFSSNFVRPINNKFKLSCLVKAYYHHNFNLHKKCLFKSDIKQWHKAIRLVLKHLHLPNDLRISRNIRNSINFVLDYNQGTNCEIVGLAERSIKWHIDIKNVEIEKDIKKRSQLTKLPEIELPTNKNIKFLSTVGDILDEGVNMSHCVGSYWKEAVKGTSYLFHIDYNGEMATAEVRNCRVKQCYGPRNHENSASKYGKRILGEWAKQIPPSIKLFEEEIDEVPF